MLRERNESGGTDTISCARTRSICTRYWGVGILDAPCLHKPFIYCVTSPARIGVSGNPTPCVGFSDSQREKFVVFAKPNGYSYGRSRSRSHWNLRIVPKEHASYFRRCVANGKSVGWRSTKKNEVNMRVRRRFMVAAVPAYC